MFFDHTIIAQSSPSGHGAISLVRLSGSKALEYTLKLFKTGEKKLGTTSLKSKVAAYGQLICAKDREAIDDVIAIFYKGPKSYTGEDLIEISCHGNPIIVERIIDAFLFLGAKIAEPGEFTRRAFYHKKLDLIQAEAVADIIHATNNQALKIARANIDKLLSAKISSISDMLTHYRVFFEAYVDFPDEEIPSSSRQKFEDDLQLLMVKLTQLLQTYDDGKILEEGAKVAIIGKPNVGKSSLLNELLRSNRAIVSPLPGTTRDLLTEKIKIRDLTLSIVDTAGLHTTVDPIEKEGIERAISQSEQADLILIVSDQMNENIDGGEMLRTVHSLNAPKLRILNKCDREFSDESKVNAAPCGTNFDVLISAKLGWGIELLKSEIYKRLVRINLDETQLILTKKRHFEAIRACKMYTEKALSESQEKNFPEIVAFELREALNQLQEITGEVSSDDILNQIFGSFCIGK